MTPWFEELIGQKMELRSVLNNRKGLFYNENGCLCVGGLDRDPGERGYQTTTRV